MDLIKEIVDALVGSPVPKQVILTKKCREKMEQQGLTEADVKDVFFHGEAVEGKKGMMTRDYHSYSIGLWFFPGKKTGDYVVTAAWKRPRP